MPTYQRLLQKLLYKLLQISPYFLQKKEIRANHGYCGLKKISSHTGVGVEKNSMLFTAKLSN